MAFTGSQSPAGHAGPGWLFNPPPGWLVPAAGWQPPAGWQPDPSWPPAPAGWEFWRPATMVRQAGEGISAASELHLVFEGRHHAFQPGQTVRIGRAPESDVVVTDPQVSRKHAQVSWLNDGWVFENTGQAGAFGTYWPWIIIQAISLFLFLGYTMSATSIEREVRRTPIFRGESMLMEVFRGPEETGEP